VEGTNRKVILLVEDEAIIALSEARTVEGFGYEVVTADSAGEAIRKATEDRKVDLVLMDIDLGEGLDGADAARRILEQRDLPIVFLTSHTEEAYVDKIKGIARYGYLLKDAGNYVLGSGIEMAFELFRAREESAERERRFLGMFKQAPLGYQSLDAEGRLLEVNQTWLDALGYRREEAVGRWFGDFVAPEDLDDFRTIFASFNNEGRTEFETRLVRKNGEQLHFFVMAWAEYDSGSNIRRSYGLISDITEKKKLEIDILKSRNLLADMGRIAKIGGWKVDIETGATQWTDELFSIFEVDSDFVPTFDQAIRFYPSPYRESMAAAIRRTNETGEGFDLEAEIVTAKGNRKWLRVIGNAECREGKIVSRVGITQDVTDRKRIETALAETGRLMTTVLDSSPEVIVFALDKNYRYIAFNSLHKTVIRRIWGRDIEIGMSMLDIINKDEDRASAKSNFDRALGGEHFMLMEEYGDESLSRLCWLDYYSPLVGPSGGVIGLTCFVLNHTERKRAEDKVVKLLREKEIILKEVHHRIKNNMNTMLSLLSVHAARLKDPAAVATMGNAQSLLRSMGVLYDKLYQTESLAEMSVYDYLPALVGEIVRVLPTAARILPVVHVEDFRLGVKELSTLGIVVNELVTNAGKYAFVGRDEGRIFLTAVKREGRIVLTIGDDGVGIPESLDFEHTTGFGLVLVSTMVRQLGGTIRLERGEGTRFVIEFPTKG